MEFVISYTKYDCASKSQRKLGFRLAQRRNSGLCNRKQGGDRQSDRVQGQASQQWLEYQPRVEGRTERLIEQEGLFDDGGRARFAARLQALRLQGRRLSSRTSRTSTSTTSPALTGPLGVGLL